MPTTLAAVTAVDRVIPCTWPCDVALREGTVVHVRFRAAPDREALVRFHEGLSPLTQRRRFLAATPHLNSKLLEILFNLEGADRVALVVEHAGQIVAVGRYSRAAGSPAAEVAFVVDDAWQNRGIGALLLEHLVAIARHHGIERFTAVTQSENTAMLDVFRSGGFPVKVERDPIEPAITTVSFPIDPTPESVRNRDARDQTAAAASIRPIARLAASISSRWPSGGASTRRCP